MKKGLESITSIYTSSSIPVVVFSDEMEIIWYNRGFASYFPGRSLEKENLSAITGTPLKQNLMKMKGYSGRFQVTIRPENSRSSIIVLLIFPLLEYTESPEYYVAYGDDLTGERNMMLRKTYLGLLEASKMKDDDTGNHIKRVGAYSRRLCEECFKDEKYPQINHDFIENIHFLAPMHDVGKIGTPDEILTKRGPLDENQWSIMKQHTINGALILSNYPDKMATEIARAHHEKWDGSGYPFGLTCEDIPLSARITALADVYDALRMKRSYKDAFDHEKAISIIKKDIGTHFDPDLTGMFLNIDWAFRDIYNALSDELPELSRKEIEDLPVYVEDSIEELFENPEVPEEIDIIEEL